MSKGSDKEAGSLRYDASPKRRESYMNEFVVECPQCTKEALITVDVPTMQNGRLTCNHCMYIVKAEDLIRYRFTVKRNCDHCGKPFETVIADQHEEVETIDIPCPHCGMVRTYTPKTESYVKKLCKPGRANDPFFNLPLWLQAEVRGDLFWAYNREHLNAIKLYVAAKLRERQTTVFTTMVERLPNFIKDAKNRKALIKVIERLEKKGME